MKRAVSEAVVRNLQHLVDPGTIAGLTERQVLARFVERRDSVAFEAMVALHGPMVLAVCRQLLRDANDVDDAFQATFVILIKKASSLRQPDRLGPWLYGVAYRVAHRARTRRRTADLKDDIAAPPPDRAINDREQFDALHDEVHLLPEKYRLPIVLCYLEGLTHDEAAARLGWPVGTIHGRLSRARDRLRARLTRRGVVPSFGVDQALAFIHIDKNVLPEALRRTTVALLDGAVPSRLQSLIKGALFNMFIEKLRFAASTVLVTVIGVATATTVLFAFQGPGKTASEPKADAAENAISQKVPTSSLTTAQPKLGPSVASTKVDNEEAASGLEELRVEAELLEITIETEKATIKNLAGFLDGVAEQIDEIEHVRSQQTKDQQRETR